MESRIAYDLPDQTGRIAVVTGANSGIGWWTSLHLARAGARVVLACRSQARADAAIVDLLTKVPDGDVEVLLCDLADQASVRAAAAAFGERYDRLDLLVLNAGVALAPYERTVDGFELQLAANFLGHFALTGLLHEVVLATPGSRVVTVGSLAARLGRIGYDDPHFERRRYSAPRGYAQSKLADLTFMVELERRLRRTTADTVSVGGHPGASFTGIADEMWIIKVPGIRAAAGWVTGTLLNYPEQAAGPSLLAATAPRMAGAGYLGPGGPFEVTGPPAPAKLPKRALSEGPRLWDLAERLTDVRFL
ncbi:MAG TPA: oxidoreductase [Marmoricola sp.]|nr:oxidoreductase [Marmoricola sp.]